VVGCLLGACRGVRTAPAPRAADLDRATLSLSLSALAAGTASDPDQTLAEARAAFEATVEPALRHQLGAEEVMAVEYRFALLQTAVQGGSDPAPIARALAAALSGAPPVRGEAMARR